MSIRFLIALWAAKASKVLIKLTKFNGTNFPGELALKLCPDFLEKIEKPESIIAVTGTNGKTTVTNMISDMLIKDGYEVLDNRLGSNINSGITTALINGVGLFGKCRYKKCVLEVDERSALRVYPYVIPDYLIITNLSRDSVMRNAHTEYISGILTKYIPKTTKLVLNADDLICAGVAPENERCYYGIDKMDTDIKKCINIINDSPTCPKCHSELEYEYLRYHHMGKAYCPNCGFKAPEYDYEGFECDTNNMTIMVKDHGESQKYPLLHDSIFNVYNVVSVVALFRQMGYSRERINELLSQIKIVGSRFNEEMIGDKKVTMLLAKDRNAYACSRVFDYVSSLEGDKEIILMMNNLSDSKNWSENICWLYDCDFEFLNRPDIKHIITTGPRTKDYKVRLLLAGVDEDKISATENEMDSPDLLRFFENDNIYVLYGTDSISLANRVTEKVKKLAGKQ